ncbi:MAG: NAD(P)/FAD-dependent oxidoreductase [Bryobacteraceae bacterium]
MAARSEPSCDVVILGAGPAGLTAAYELVRCGARPLVLEKDSVVGGLARTVRYKGFLLDIGGHRFFTKVSLVERMWREVLGADLLERPRLSRIYYRGKFFRYPLEPFDALRGLGMRESLLCTLSYLRAKLRPRHPEGDLESWLTNRFGRRLFEIFFRTYTEKVWGLPCNRISAEWASQRIRGLSPGAILRNAFSLAEPGKQHAVKTLIRRFFYPRRGPGMMWERTRDLVEAGGGRVVLGAPVERVFWTPGRVVAVQAGGRLWRGEHFISSIALADLIRALDPEPPPELRAAADDFHYRDFLTVALIVEGRDLFPDQWIYVHDPGVRVGRIQNYNNWSREMSPDPEKTCLGMEYFCSRGDELWRMQDAALIELARREIAQLGLARADRVVDGAVVRMEKAYPVYDDSYLRGLRAVRQFLESLPNLQVIGRNGMHRYNNQDHSMLTGMLAARNIAGGNFDLWRVNAEEDYLEEGEAQTGAEALAWHTGAGGR